MNSCFQISCLACTAYQHVSECCLSFTAVFWASELHAQVPPRRDRCVTFVVRRVRQGVLEFFSGVENRARAARRGGEQARLVQPDVVDVVAASKVRLVQSVPWCCRRAGVFRAGADGAQGMQAASPGKG